MKQSTVSVDRTAASVWQCRRRAFSLVELLMVIVIIGFLMTLILPVVTKVRERAYVADTMAQINALRAAIEAYQMAFGSYPGPLGDLDMYNSANLPLNIPTGGPPQQVSMAENLVLGLLGGLYLDNSNQVVYDPSLVGQGPRDLRTTQMHRNRTYKPFYENWAGQLSEGRFHDGGRFVPGLGLALDTDIPEFLDRFPQQPMPILYLRARVGASGIISGASSPSLYQYDLRQISSYTSIHGGQDVAAPPTMSYYGRPQGLWRLGPWFDLTRTPIPPANPQIPAVGYFSNPGVLPSEPTPGRGNETGTPRAKDGFILISAGPDRMYGTIDDITTFGSVLP